MNAIELFQQADALSKYLSTSYDVNGQADGKVIYQNPEFVQWKENVIFELGKLKQQTIVTDTIGLLQGFDGWNDEQDLITLQAKMRIIVSHIDELSDSLEDGRLNEKPRLSRGFIVHTAFSDYQLDKQIGQGGNGRVFSATDSSNASVAIKFVSDDVSGEKKKRLKNEIYFCEHADNPYIIKVLDHGYIETIDGGFLFYVMPIYKFTLREKMKTGLNSEDIINIFCGILRGLEYAHEKGIIHRDIKPENILLSEQTLKPVICDFGIAHFSQEELLTAVETRAADRLANFHYCAPEQKRRGASVSNRTDLYAMGLMLNEMFTGEIPQAPDYKTIALVNPQYAFLDQLVEHLFRQLPEDRPESAKDVLREIEILASINKGKLEANHISKQIEEMEKPPMIQLSAQKVYAKDGILLFSMSEVVPDSWFSIFQYERFSGGAVQGYEKSRAFLYDNRTIGLRISGGESQGVLQSIVGFLKDWVETTNQIYNRNVEIQYYQEKRNAEEKLRKELEKQANMQRISEIVSQLSV